MKAENKIPLNEVYRLFNERKCEKNPYSLFLDLLWCWRRRAHKKTAGKDGFLSRTNTALFLDYACE